MNILIASVAGAVVAVVGVIGGVHAAEQPTGTSPSQSSVVGYADD